MFISCRVKAYFWSTKFSYALSYVPYQLSSLNILPLMIFVLYATYCKLNPNGYYQTSVIYFSLIRLTCIKPCPYLTSSSSSPAQPYIRHALNNDELRGFPNLSLFPSWTGSDRFTRRNAAAFESVGLTESKMFDDLEVIMAVAEKRTQRKREIKGHWECAGRWRDGSYGPSCKVKGRNNLGMGGWSS